MAILKLFGAIALTLVNAASAEQLQGSAVSWWVYAPAGNRFEAATLTLDPAPPGGAALSSACTGQLEPDGTASGRCHIADAGGNAWDESFRCDQPARRAPMALPALSGMAGCQGEVVISGGSGAYRA